MERAWVSQCILEAALSSLDPWLERAFLGVDLTVGFTRWTREK